MSSSASKSGEGHRSSRGATEGALFRTQLGARWDSLAESIRTRFDHDPPLGTIVRYRGVMSRVECSSFGKALAWLVQRTGALMPHEGVDVPVLLEVWTEAGNAAVFKKREYLFKGRKPFVFRSKMLLDPNGDLIEHIGGGFGMYVRVHAANGNLQFEDDGYFFQAFGWRIPIPRALGPGRVLLRHEDLGAREFSITIEIDHPWFGRLYFQEGQFAHDAPQP